MKGKLKKFLTVILCMSLICNIVGMQGFGIKKAYAAGDTKITGVTEAKASSESSNPASWAIDPLSEESWWSADATGVCWLQLTLDHTYYIDRWYVINVGIFDGWDAYNTRDYKLQGSLDGINWTDIDNVVGNTADITNRTVAPFSAKYVRIYITNPDQNGNVAQAFGNIVDFEIFATTPVVSSVGLPSNNNYSAGNALTFHVEYPAEITVNTAGGTPYIPVTIGTKIVNAAYKSGSGTQSLTFEYIVQSDDYDDNGITLGTSINSNGGIIRDFASNNANLTLNGVGGTSGIVVDTRPRYNISIGTLVDGSISASVPAPYSTATVVAGETINLNITPVAGKQLKSGSLKYNDGTSDHTITGTSFTMPAANVTVTAEFEGIPHVVTIGSLTGGTITSDKSEAVENETVSLTITPDTGKQLKAGSLKYNDGTNSVDITGTSFDMPNSDVTVAAEFETKRCTVQFNPNWTAMVPNEEVNYGEKITAPTVDTPGVRQDGWYTDSNFATKWNFNTDTVQQDMTLYLRYTPIGNVVFNSNGGGTVNSQTVGIGEKVQEPSGVEKDGYTLDGWYLSSNFSGAKYDFNSTGTSAEVNQVRTLYANWIPIPAYNITIDVLNGGSITANPVSGAVGSSISLTIIPNPGKQLKAGSLKYNDGTQDVAIVGTNFTMPAANVTISAEFEDALPIVYPVIAGPTNGGIINVSIPIAPAGSNINLNIIPDTGKQLKAGSLKYYDGTQEVVITGTSFIMPAAPVLILAEFEDIPVIPAPTYTVTTGTVIGGTITANPATAASGSSISLTVVPNPGKQLKAGSLKYNDGTQDVAIVGTNFTMPAANVTISAEFEDALPIVYPVIVGPTNGGIINVSIPIAPAGSNINLNIIPDTGKQLKAGSLKYYDGMQEVVINGTSFTMPSAPVLVTAEFENIPVIVAPSIDPTPINNGTPISGTPATPTDSKIPSVEGSEAKGWDSIIQYVSDNNEGSITVDMNGDTTVKQEIFEAIKGKDIDMTFDLGNGIEWVINGTDIPESTDDSQLHGIDLNLSMNTDSIPAELLDNLAGTERVQISLAYDGSFGFSATLRLPLDERNSGKIANLFYYNPVTNQLELQAVGMVNNNGKVEFPFTHASDYVVVMSTTAMLDDAIDQITVSPAKKTLYIGGTKGTSVTLETIVPESIQKAVSDGLCDMKVTYKSSNPKVATVSDSGKIIAKKTGMVTITTTIIVNGVEKNIQTTIKVKKAFIKFTKCTKTMKLGETYTFQATGYGIDVEDITFTTSKKSVVTINKRSGKATVKSAGVDYVIAKAGNVEVKIKVVVQE